MFKLILFYLHKIKENPFILQSVKTMALRVIGIFTLFVFTLFLTHNFNPKIIGQYEFIRTYFLVVGSLCLLGTDQSILYFAGVINGNTKDLKNIYLKKVTLVFFSSLIPFAILLLTGEEKVGNFFNDKHIYTLLIKASAILFFYCITILNTETFRAINKVYIAELFTTITLPLDSL